MKCTYLFLEIWKIYSKLKSCFNHSKICKYECWITLENSNIGVMQKYVPYMSIIWQTMDLYRFLADRAVPEVSFEYSNYLIYLPYRVHCDKCVMYPSRNHVYWLKIDVVETHWNDLLSLFMVEIIWSLIF